jgi:hypothetical protein
MGDGRWEMGVGRRDCENMKLYVKSAMPINIILIDPAIPNSEILEGCDIGLPSPPAPLPSLG